MTNFKEEAEKLIEWRNKEEDKINKEMINKYGITRDGAEHRERHGAIREKFYKRLSALKKKYGITAQNDAVREQNSVRDTSHYASGK